MSHDTPSSQGVAAVLTNRRCIQRPDASPLFGRPLESHLVLSLLSYTQGIAALQE